MSVEIFKVCSISIDPYPSIQALFKVDLQIVNLESSPCFKITYWPASRTLCILSERFKTYISYNGMKSFLLRSTVLCKCVVVGWCSAPSHSATSTDQGEDTGQHVAKKGLQNICVYPPVKPSELYLPQSNIPSTETSQEESEVPSEIRSVLLYLQTEATPNALQKMQTHSGASKNFFMRGGFTDSSSSLRRHRLVNNTLREFDLRGSEKTRRREKKWRRLAW